MFKKQIKTKPPKPWGPRCHQSSLLSFTWHHDCNRTITSLPLGGFRPELPGLPQLIFLSPLAPLGIMGGTGCFGSTAKATSAGGMLLVFLSWSSEADVLKVPVSHRQQLAPLPFVCPTQHSAFCGLVLFIPASDDSTEQTRQVEPRSHVRWWKRRERHRALGGMDLEHGTGHLFPLPAPSPACNNLRKQSNANRRAQLLPNPRLLLPCPRHPICPQKIPPAPYLQLLNY